MTTAPLSIRATYEEILSPQWEGSQTVEDWHPSLCEVAQFTNEFVHRVDLWYSSFRPNLLASRQSLIDEALHAPKKTSDFARLRKAASLVYTGQALRRVISDFSVRLRALDVPELNSSLGSVLALLIESVGLQLTQPRGPDSTERAWLQSLRSSYPDGGVQALLQYAMESRDKPHWGKFPKNIFLIRKVFIENNFEQVSGDSCNDVTAQWSEDALLVIITAFSASLVNEKETTTLAQLVVSKIASKIAGTPPYSQDHPPPLSFDSYRMVSQAPFGRFQGDLLPNTSLSIIPPEPTLWGAPTSANRPELVEAGPSSPSSVSQHSYGERETPSVDILSTSADSPEESMLCGAPTSTSCPELPESELDPSPGSASHHSYGERETTLVDELSASADGPGEPMSWEPSTSTNRPELAEFGLDHPPSSVLHHSYGERETTLADELSASAGGPGEPMSWEPSTSTNHPELAESGPDHSPNSAPHTLSGDSGNTQAGQPLESVDCLGPTVKVMSTHSDPDLAGRNPFDSPLSSVSSLPASPISSTVDKSQQPPQSACLCREAHEVDPLTDVVCCVCGFWQHKECLRLDRLGWEDEFQRITNFGWTCWACNPDGFAY
ncbi:hypothetical protein FRB94_010936 [Tulasnella sp. JGI-2019a]|nr:hypothetical protein FRB94_010936 [Tulasnella sp. JGI-2019a]